MTVLPLRAPGRAARSAPSAAPCADVSGAFASPSGRAGAMAGSFRLQRLVHRLGDTTAWGVVTGRLVEADGSWVGLAARRVRIPVGVEVYGGTARLLLPGLEVDLLGLAVRLDPLEVDVPRTWWEQSLRGWSR